MQEPTEQIRVLNRMLVSGAVFLVAFVTMGVCLVLFGDKQIGEPRVTAKDIPALTVIFALVITMVGTAFYLKHLALRHDNEFEAVEFEESDDDGEVDEDAEAPSATFERFHLAIWVSFIAFLWPDKWKPVPDEFNVWWTAVAAIAVAVVVLALVVRAWQKVQELKNA